MTLAKAISVIRRWRPESANDLLETCGFPLRFVGAGQFRKVYEIIRAGLVVKLPIDPRDAVHSRNEYRVWRRMKKSPKYDAIRGYLPDIHYFSRNSGLVLMPLYKEPNGYRYGKQMDRIGEIVSKMLGISDPDICSGKWDNFGVDARGKLRITDLGLFSEDRT